MISLVLNFPAIDTAFHIGREFSSYPLDDAQWVKGPQNLRRQALSMYLRGTIVPETLGTFIQPVDKLTESSETPVRFSPELIEALQASPEVNRNSPSIMFSAYWFA